MSDNEYTVQRDLPMSNSWISHPKHMNERSLSNNDVEYHLENNNTSIDSVPGLKTSLFPHQKTVVRAMLDLEISKCHGLKGACRNVYEMRTTAGVLSESVGSGKTIDIISVILLQKMPPVVPCISELNMVGIASRRKYSNMFTGIIKKRFRDILKPTIIFAGVSVVNQWVSAIKTFTSLRYFIVFDVKDLQKLINCMSDKSINDYDIVIVKNGKVTRSVVLPKNIKVEAKNLNKSTKYIYNIVANMRNYCWARVVVDDFDTIKLPYNAGIVNGLFTWYISSTKKHISNGRSQTCHFKTTSEMLMYSNYSCCNIMRNNILFYNLNIRNNPEFVNGTNNINSPNFYAYTFVNPDNQYMGFLSLIGDAESKEILEMLNGDAIETAAERLGIKTSKVADIFQIMLGKQFDRYTKAADVLKFINEIEPMQGRRKPMSCNPNSDDTYKKSDLFIRREINYNYHNLKGLIDETKTEYSEILRESSISIERVKKNIKEGECPICLGDLDDDEEEILILKCCGIVLCGMCCFGTVFPKKSPTGQCSNCRAQLKLCDLIYLTKGFDLTKIVNADIDDVKSDDVKSDDVKSRDKISAIVDIIRGNKPEERRRVDVNIHNLMKGTYILPELNYHKVLIFANYEETIGKIKIDLIEQKINFWQLCGSHKEISDTVAKFTNCNETCVLIINSMEHCSGLNLQTATDLIFAHKIIDPNIETQVIGRGQRLGRTTTLNVHFMLYQNEYDLMAGQNSIREIYDSDNVVSEISGLSIQDLISD